MDNFKPRKSTDWELIAPFVRDVVSLAAPRTSYTVSRLLSATKNFVLWCRTQGWPLKADIIFSRQAIELYCNSTNLGLGEGTRRNYRSMLLRVSEVLLPDEQPEPLTPLNARSSQPPYTRAEIDEFVPWALGQNTIIKRRKAMIMVALCAGAGLHSAEVGLVLREDVRSDDAGIVITVTGRNARDVPLLCEYEDWILAVVDSIPAGTPLWGSPNRINSKNMLSSFTATTTGCAPRGDRLRATWIVTHLTSGTRMKEFLKACGIRKFENLAVYLDYVDALDEGGYRRALRGQVTK